VKERVGIHELGRVEEGDEQTNDHRDGNNKRENEPGERDEMNCKENTNCGG
jgi:hypothetical protein